MKPPLDAATGTLTPLLSPWVRLGLVWSVLALGGAILGALPLGLPQAPAWLSPVGAAVAAVGLFGWWRGRAEVRRALGRGDRWARERALSGANAYASLVLGVALGAGLTLVSARHPKQIDLSASRSSSLSEQSEQILRGLKGEVRLVYAFAGSPPSSSALALLDAYAAASPRVQRSSLDAALNPATARELGLRLPPDGAAVLVQRVSGSGSEARIEAQREVEVVNGALDEARLSGAILAVSQGKPRRLYTLSGHGEVQLALSAQGDFNTLTRDLLGQNVLIGRLAPGSRVPSDAAAILAIAPASDLSAADEKILGDYFAAGGRLVLWLEPTAAPLPRWSALLRRLGLRWGPGVVFDPAQNASNSPQLARGPLDDDVLGQVASDPLRARILRGAAGDGVFLGAVPLQVLPPPAGARTRAIFSTSVQAVARAGGEGGAVVARGPFPLAAAVENGVARAVVAGDADFASDRFASSYGNRSIALACLNWASGEDALVRIPPRPPISNVLSMPSEAQAASRFLALVALPVALVLWGGWNRWRRR